LAVMLREFVAGDPERFARLSLRFPPGTNPMYLERTLEALKETDAPAQLKLDVCRKAYTEYAEVCGKAIADLLGSLTERLPEDAVGMVCWLATGHPDPEKEVWTESAGGGKLYYNGDCLMHGRNTTRGHAAEAIRDLILRDSEYVVRFRMVVECLVNDRSVSVRACAASTLRAVAQHDSALAFQLFLVMLEADDRLLATRYVEGFLAYGLVEHFSALGPVIERMLHSEDPKVNQAGARLASLATLHGKEAADLVQEAMAGSPATRLGIAQVAAQNVASSDCRSWCEEQLLRLFNDENQEVQDEAASCFLQLEAEPLEKYEGLIMAFCDSAAYEKDSNTLLRTLESSRDKLPGITCAVCETFVTRFRSEADDISTKRFGDGSKVAKLVFRIYHQHQGDQWAGKCLDLIDRMCLQGIGEVRTGFEEFDR